VSNLLGICQLGIPRRDPDSGNPRWPKDGGESYNLPGGPVAEDSEGMIRPGGEAIGPMTKHGQIRDAQDKESCT
jgi:hypothetical protein